MIVRHTAETLNLAIREAQDRVLYADASVNNALQTYAAAGSESFRIFFSAVGFAIMHTAWAAVEAAAETELNTGEASISSLNGRLIASDNRNNGILPNKVTHFLPHSPEHTKHSECQALVPITTLASSLRMALFLLAS
jgi:hypothetical protein